MGASMDMVNEMIRTGRDSIEQIREVTDWPTKNILAAVQQLGYVLDPDGKPIKRAGAPRIVTTETAVQIAKERLTPRAPTLSPTRPAPPSDPYAELLAAAAQSSHAGLRKRSESLIRSLTALRQELSDYAEVEKVKREIGRRETELKALREKARGLSKPPSRHVKSRNVSPEYAEQISQRNRERYQAEQELLETLGTDRDGVRAWAVEQGIECSDRGFLRQNVLDAYVAAHSGQEAAS